MGGEGSAYDSAFTDRHLLFTYPPATLVVFTPRSRIPVQAAAPLTIVISPAATVLVSLLSERAIGVRGWTPICTSLLVAGLSTLWEPVRATLVLGQVHLLLMLLVVAGALWIPPRCGGIATGFAAALKLTPLGFIASSPSPSPQSLRSGSS